MADEAGLQLFLTLDGQIEGIGESEVEQVGNVVQLEGPPTLLPHAVDTVYDETHAGCYEQQIACPSIL